MWTSEKRPTRKPQLTNAVHYRTEAGTQGAASTGQGAGVQTALPKGTTEVRTLARPTGTHCAGRFLEMNRARMEAEDNRASMVQMMHASDALRTYYKNWLHLG